MIDFTLSPEIKEMRRKAKTFLDEQHHPQRAHRCASTTPRRTR